MAAVPPFAEAYPTPWRISSCGQEIQDRDGNHVNAADLDDPDEREFWTGIVVAVNLHVDLLAFVEEVATRDPVFAKAFEKKRIAEAKALVTRAEGRSDG